MEGARKREEYGGSKEKRIGREDEKRRIGGRKEKRRIGGKEKGRIGREQRKEKNRGEQGYRSWSHFIICRNSLPACCIPVRAIYIRKISFVP